MNEDLRQDIMSLSNRITKAKIRMLVEHPFYGLLAQRVGFAIDPSCETACTDGKTIYFGREFSSQIDNDQLYFVLLHEMLHIVLGHCFRARDLDNFMYNIAADIVINSIIMDEFKVNEFYILNDLAMHKTPENKDGRFYTAEEVYAMIAPNPEKAIEKLSIANNSGDKQGTGGQDGGESQRRNDNSKNGDGLYKEINSSEDNGSKDSTANGKQKRRGNESSSHPSSFSCDENDSGSASSTHSDNDKEINGDIENDGKNGDRKDNGSKDLNANGKQNSSGNESSSRPSGSSYDENGSGSASSTHSDNDKEINGDVENDGENGDKNTENKSKKIFPNNFFDDHSHWGDLEDNELNKSIWKQQVYEVYKELENANMAGTVPVLVKRMVEEIIHPTIDWKSVLINFIQQEVNDYSFSPPDRRFQDGIFLLPDFNETEEKIENVFVAVDTSGSISSKQVSLAINEIKGAIDQFNGKFKGWLSYFDYQVTEPKEFESFDDVKKIEIKGGGGTSFINVINMANEFFKGDIMCIIIITDGIATYPKESDTLGVPVLWLLNNNKITPPWGIVARMIN